MAQDFRLSNVAAKDMADALDAAINVGSTASTIRILTTARPADPDTAETGTLLAVATCNDPAYGTATDAAPGGAIALDTTPTVEDTSANAGGVAAYFRIAATGIGADDVADGECGTSASDLNFNNLTITAGATVTITSHTITMPET
jgi:hypothetical protein